MSVPSPTQAIRHPQRAVLCETSHVSRIPGQAAESGPAIWRFARSCWSLRWVVVVGMVLTVGAIHYVGSRPGVFYSETRVRLVRAPVSYANPLTDSGEIVAATGVLQRVVGGIPGPSVVSLDVTLADEGVRQGESVQIWNGGGQWNNWYNKPELLVEVVGPSEEEVDARMTSLLTKIDDQLATMQRKQDVRQQDTISTQRIPSSVSVVHLAGKPKQAMAVTGLLGVAMTAATINFLSWRRPRRRGSDTASDVLNPQAGVVATT